MPEAHLDLFSQRHLPPRPSLEHLKNEAKRRLHALRAAAPDARLADVQHRLAREYGFANWRDLKASVDRTCHSPSSDWIGLLPGNNHVALHIRPQDSGFAVTMDTPDFGFFDMPAENVSLDEERLSFTLLAPLPVGSHQGFYEARWDAEGRQWAGEWTAHGVTTELNFARGVYPPAPTFDGLDGFWDGRLKTSEGLIRLIFRFKTDRHGTYAWLDSPDRNLLGRPAVSIRREGREVTVTMRTVTVSGMLIDDGQWIEGRLVKDGVILPLTLIRRPPGAAAPLPQRAPIIDLPPETLARYVGRYVTDLGTLLDVTLERGSLWAQFSLSDHQPQDGGNTGPKLELLASSPRRFLWRIMDASIEFETAADGRVTGMLTRQNGRESRARRLD
ncbi:MAG TPA: DUF3471 domain-containing protein [Phenylobacterium sp.]|jgi:hypothetical protein|nr:DUF3471 domain-containing protein [Phenylobacterium sp.]